MIIAKVIADSTANGIRLTTMELEYPRFIHSELMAHRMFSRNASSSRAIPVQKMLDQVRNNPAMPIHWGKNKPGMQADEELDSQNIRNAIITWNGACESAVFWAEAFAEDGVHKQITNRLLEPFQHIKVIVTATEWDNFFKLRLHSDAQPEIQELARRMKEVMDASTPKDLKSGEWHLPYVKPAQYTPYYDSKEVFLRDMIKCSAAGCARVSYDNHDGANRSMPKDIKLADDLLAAGHMSPFEHQATPMDFAKDTFELAWEQGISHKDRDNNFWSGNFRGWIQYRQLLNSI